MRVSLSFTSDLSPFPGLTPDVRVGEEQRSDGGGGGGDGGVRAATTSWS